MKLLSRSLLLVWVLSGSGPGLAADVAQPAAAAATAVLTQAHAHNDYEHARPLRDALEQGFGSIEADVWLVDGRLLVAHTLAEVVPGRTLQSLYLDPLRERIRQNGGRVYRDGPACTLLVEVKSAAEPTTAALLQVFAEYTNMLTRFTDTNTMTNALTIILTGNRSTTLVAAQACRWAALDGTLADLGTGAAASLVPLISGDWSENFQWRGAGSFPDGERQKLRQLVAQAHAQGRRLRFWEAPDQPAGWRELQAAGVDLIGTDDLAGLAALLRAPAR